MKEIDIWVKNLEEWQNEIDVCHINELVESLPETDIDYNFYVSKKTWGYLEALNRSLGSNTYVIRKDKKPAPILWGYEVEFDDNEIGIRCGNELSEVRLVPKEEPSYVRELRGRIRLQDGVIKEITEAIHELQNKSFFARLFNL